ncbi:MAG TPA: hypothetical protein VIL03_05265 [Clostridia bacterium]|jgi:hypothetical protein
MDDQDFIVFDEQDYINKLYEQSESSDAFASNAVTSQDNDFETQKELENTEAVASVSHEENSQEADQITASTAVQEKESTSNNIIMPRKITGRQR